MKGHKYAKDQKANKSKGADSSSDEGVGQWQQEFVSGYIPKW